MRTTNSIRTWCCAPQQEFKFPNFMPLLLPVLHFTRINTIHHTQQHSPPLHPLASPEVIAEHLSVKKMSMKVDHSLQFPFSIDMASYLSSSILRSRYGNRIFSSEACIAGASRLAGGRRSLPNIGGVLGSCLHHLPLGMLLCRRRSTINLLRSVLC
jgi:hypothetical protein